MGGRWWKKFYWLLIINFFCCFVIFIVVFSVVWGWVVYWWCWGFRCLLCSWGIWGLLCLCFFRFVRCLRWFVRCGLFCFCGERGWCCWVLCWVVSVSRGFWVVFWRCCNGNLLWFCVVLFFVLVIWRRILGLCFCWVECGRLVCCVLVCWERGLVVGVWILWWFWWFFWVSVCWCVGKMVCFVSVSCLFWVWWWCRWVCGCCVLCLVFVCSWVWFGCWGCWGCIVCVWWFWVFGLLECVWWFVVFWFFCCGWCWFWMLRVFLWWLG